MLRFGADENFTNKIVRGLRRRNKDLDIRTIQDANLSGATDSEVLEWTARENCVLLTHDVSTITKYAYARVEAGLPMPGFSRFLSSSPSALPSTTYCFWQSVASIMSGPIRYGICHSESPSFQRRARPRAFRK